MNKRSWLDLSLCRKKKVTWLSHFPLCLNLSLNLLISQYLYQGALSAFKAEVLEHSKALTLNRGPPNKKTEEAVRKDHPISRNKLICVHYGIILSVVL